MYQTHDDLQEILFAGGPLGVGQTYDNPGEGFTVTALQDIDGGMTVRVTMVPDARCPRILEEIKILDEQIQEETDQEVLRALREQRKRLHDQVVQLGCVR